MKILGGCRRSSGRSSLELLGENVGFCATFEVSNSKIFVEVVSEKWLFGGVQTAIPLL